MRSAAALLAVAAVAAAGAAPLPAAGAPRPKAPDPIATAGARPGGGGAVAFARVGGGPPRLLVTFADAPGAGAARARLGGLGRADPVLPEAGVWSLRPSAPGAARARALGRPAVAAAEWSLARRDAQAGAPFSDPLFASGAQWWLGPGAPPWGIDLTVLGPRPAIAILDSGIDRDHPEWGGPGSPLVAPYSATGADGGADDRSLTGHGTHVAGIAAAPADGLGVVGVAPARGDAPVMPVQIANAFGEVDDADMIRGIRWAVRHGARVINISAGGPGFARALQDTIDWAALRGAVVVASVGNEGQDGNPLNFPAAYRRVIGVGAQCDGVVSGDCPEPYGVARFSNYNRSVDVIAPGVNMLSTLAAQAREGRVAPGYGVKDGTSMSAPYVSGVVALLQARHGGALSPHQVLRQLAQTATDIGVRGREPRSGYGVVNPRAAVVLDPPADDLAEVNDDVKYVGRRARLLTGRDRGVLRASIDAVEDPDDVYAIQARRGEKLRVTLTHRTGQLDLYLWGPGTRTVRTNPGNVERNLLRFSGRRGTGRQVVVHRATRSGRHYIDVYARAGRDAYRLDVRRTR